MKNHTIQKLIYELVSKLFVFPIYKFLFKGHLIGRENIPQKGSFIMVSNHGSLLDPPLLGHALGRNISFMAKAELFRIPFLGFIIKACGAYPVKDRIVWLSFIGYACFHKCTCITGLEIIVSHIMHITMSRCPRYAAIWNW